MSATTLWISALPAFAAIAVIAWAVATLRRNVGLVDVFWSLFFLAAAMVYAWHAAPLDARALLVIALTTTWALRLASYLAWRNWSAPEDRRYVAIRERNSPGFEWKSLYLVFGFQAVLAWLLSAPLAGAIAGAREFSALDYAGAALALFGIAFETIGDWQLARFKAQPGNSGRVMDRGLWRYTRHPNYFGECCVWWGVYLIAFAAGAWWTIFAPIVMTVLLVKYTGVALLEDDLRERRPAYRDYIARTNAFVPGPPRGT